MMLDELMKTAEETLGKVYPNAVVEEWIDHKLRGMWNFARQELGMTKILDHTKTV